MKKKKDHYLNVLFFYLGVNAKQFAESLGFKRADRIYNVLRGENGISSDLAKIIIDKYPSVNYEWLLTGKGSMATLTLINEGNVTNSNVVGNNVVGSGNKVVGDITLTGYQQELDFFKKETARLSRLLEEKDERLKDKDEIITLQKEQINMLKELKTPALRK
jgi:hypothetical protein